MDLTEEILSLALKGEHGAVAALTKAANDATQIMKALSDAAGAIDGLCHQVEQMRGMFSDDDNTIQEALDDGEAALVEIGRLTMLGVTQDAPAAISRLLVVSTAHLTPQTLARLNDIIDPNCLPFAGGISSDGWFAYAHDENVGVGEDEIPEDLWGLMVYARSQDCDYLRIDPDACTIPGLPTYDDDGNPETMEASQ
jgi:hypothetical protein